MSKLRNVAMNIAKKNVLFRRTSKYGVHVLKKSKYLYYFLTTKMDDKKIVFESFMGRTYSDSQKELYKAMLNYEYF